MLPKLKYSKKDMKNAIHAAIYHVYCRHNLYSKCFTGKVVGEITEKIFKEDDGNWDHQRYDYK